MPQDVVADEQTDNSRLLQPVSSVHGHHDYTHQPQAFVEKKIITIHADK